MSLIDSLFERIARRLGFEVQKARKTQSIYGRRIRTASVIPGTPKRGANLLRNFAETNEWVRGAINRRKHKLGQARWNIVRTDDPKKAPDKAVVAKVRDIFRVVNPTRMSFREMLDQVVEDLLVLDAGCIEKERNAGGAMIALWPVDGASIAVDPKWPDGKGGINAPRYYQYDQYQKIADLSNNDLVYMKHNSRTHSPIGWSPVESLMRIIEAELYGEQYDIEMLRQHAPEGILDLGRGLTPEQVTEFREYYQQEIAGTKDLAIYGGGGENGIGGELKFIPTKPTAKDQERDLYRKWLAKKIAFVFEMDETAFNITDNSNRATSKTTSARTDEGMVGLATLVAEFIEREIVWEIDENHGFEFTDIITRDEMAQSAIDGAYLDRGVWVINEVRAREGQEAVAWGNKPFKMPQAGTPLDEDGSQSPPPEDPNNPNGDHGDPDDESDAAGSTSDGGDDDQGGGTDKGARPFVGAVGGLARSRGVKPLHQTQRARFGYLAS